MPVSYTYTLTNGTTADASQVQQNFEDVKDVADEVESDLTAALAGMRIKAGQVDVTWPGGSQQSNTYTVAHGLGTTPIACLATHNDQTGTGLLRVEAFFDATNVVIRVETNAFQPANTVTSPVSWLVIG